MAIQSLGVGSGLDISSIVTQLVAAERTPKELRLANRETQIQAKISAMGAVKSLVSDFQSSYLNLKLASNYTKISATSSDTSVFSATASTSAAAGTHTVQVNKLAQSQVLTLDTAYAEADTTTSIGTGSLVFDFADATQETVTITDGSLSGIRDAINNANIGLTANVVYNGTGYVLSIEGESGANNAFTITAKDAGALDIADDTGLGRFEYDSALPAGPGNYMGATQTAQDAEILFDGVSVTSSTNTISNPVSGVDLTLKSEDAGVSKTLTIGQNTSAISSAVSDMVESFNALKSALNDMTYYDQDTGDRGLFLGDNVIRGIDNQIKKVISGTVGDFSTTYNSFASIGVTTGDDGTLEFDESKLSAALSGNLDQVRNLFIGNSAALQSSQLDQMTFSNIPSGESESSLLVNITQAAEQGYYYGGNVGSYFDPYDVAGTLTAPAADFVFDANMNFSFQLDGGATTYNVDFSGGQTITSGFNMADEAVVYMQAQINAALVAGGGTADSVVVSYAAGGFKLSSASYGSTSTVDVTAVGVDTSSKLGFSTATGVAGKDIAGTINNESAFGVGQVLTANDGTSLDGGTGADTSDNTSVTYTGSLTSSQVSTQSVGGLLGDLDNLLDSFLDSDGIFSARSEGYQDQLDEIEDSRERLDLRVSALESRLISQFSAMDALVAQLNSTGSFLTNQLKNLPSTANK